MNNFTTILLLICGSIIGCSGKSPPPQPPTIVLVAAQCEQNGYREQITLRITTSEPHTRDIDIGIAAKKAINEFYGRLSPQNFKELTDSVAKRVAAVLGVKAESVSATVVAVSYEEIGQPEQ